MLVQNSVYRNTYLTDGVNKDFYFSFPILESSQVLVQTSLLTDTDVVTKVTTVDPSQYTVTGVGQTTGGHISFTTAPPTGSRIALTLNIPITQLYQYAELDSFPAKSHEDALAKFTLICQQLKEQLERAVKLPSTSSESPETVVASIYASRDAAAASASAAAQSAVAAAAGAGTARTEFLQETRAVLEDFPTVADAISSPRRVSVRSDITVCIPSDAATLQIAVDKLVPDAGVKITLLIESGHSLTDGCHVSHGDFGGFIIKAEDAVVKTAPNFPDAKSIVYAEYAIAPTLECMVDMEMRGCSGYYLKHASTGFVKPGCGVDNPGGKGAPGLTGIGLFVWGASRVWAYAAIFRGGFRNLWVTHESAAYCDQGNFDEARGATGVYIARSSIAGISYGSVKNCQENAVMVRRSRLTAMQTDLSNAGRSGAGSAVIAREGSVVLISQGGETDLEGANLSGPANIAIDCDGSFVNAFNTNMDGAGGVTINALNGAVVLANGSTLRNSPRAISATTGSIVVAPRIIAENNTLDAIKVEGAKVIINHATISNTPIAIKASIVSAVVANDSIITNCPTAGVLANNSRIDLTKAKIDACKNGVEADSLSVVSGRYIQVTNSTQYGIYSIYGSQVLIRQGKVIGSLSQDLRVQKGGQILAASASTTDGTDAPSLSNTNVTTFNQWTSNGVIFD